MSENTGSNALKLIIVLCLCLFIAGAAFGAQSPRTTIDLSGSGWSLWLDKDAKWENDTLYLPPVDVKTLPVNPPTVGWDKMYKGEAITAAVPGTVEEYAWDDIAKAKNEPNNATAGDYKGVSWWWKSFAVPTSAKGKRVILHFDAVRLRAEVFLNEKLVGYNLIDSTPFDVDITGKCLVGQKNRLAVRVTDPCGNFDWVDWDVHKWGKYSIPPSHGFGGIFAPVTLSIVDPLSVSDIFIKNHPYSPTDKNTQPAINPRYVEIAVSTANTTGKPLAGVMDVAIRDASTNRIIKKCSPLTVKFMPGNVTKVTSVFVPNAILWDTDNPNLYYCDVKIAVGGKIHDATSQRFGFRWFNVDGIGKDAVFRLNGKRVFLQSAISWGFWPGNGLYPTEELATKHILAAKRFGMNMLHFHRCIGNNLVFDKADELGLMYFEEPGGYRNGNGDKFSKDWSAIKLNRMIKRDRNRPSLVIYNMINEAMREPEPREYTDMAAAHKIDPTRIITFTSAWAKDRVDDPVKLYMLPYDNKQYIKGWFDSHHAPGPGGYRNSFYTDPKRFSLYTSNREEIIFWGEEGAIGTPSRLPLIVKDIDKAGRNGWDGAWYKKWHQAYEKFLDEKSLRTYFPTTDGLIQSIGNIAMYYHGRMIENCRAGDITDAYITNGWEAELTENHSGIVDCWRNPKGDPNLISRYNRPAYVAVKIRNKIDHAPATIVTDFYAVNQINLNGSYVLTTMLKDPKGKVIARDQKTVTLVGGDTFGQLLDESVPFDVSTPGRYKMVAQLQDNTGTIIASGDDEALIVDWKSMPIPDGGALLDSDNLVKEFVRDSKNTTIPTYSDSLGKLKYVVVAASEWGLREVFPTEVVTSLDGRPGFTAEYFSGTNFEQSLIKRVDTSINFGPQDLKLDPGRRANYSVRWTGKFKVPETGKFQFQTAADDGVRLWIDGKLVIDDWNTHDVTTDKTDWISLDSGRVYDIKMEYYQGDGGRSVRLFWVTPAMSRLSNPIDSVINRVKNDGTTLLIVGGADKWAKELGDRGVVKFNGIQNVGDVWVGGNLFVREHPLFKDLPVNQGMNWEYQDLATYSVKRYGLLLDGEEVVAGTVNYNEPRLGTAVGIVKYGQGKIIFSTLDLKYLNAQSGGSDVVRKLLCNFIDYAANGQ